MNRIFTFGLLLVSLAGCDLIPDLVPEGQFLNPNDPKSTAYAPVSALAAPADLDAFGGNTTITVTWSPVTTATSYNLYWSTTSPVDRQTAEVVTDASSPYLLSNLDNGTKYYFAVTAVAADGETVASDPVEATPSTVVQVASGWAHTLVVKSDGSLWATGENDAGQLGDGTNVNRSSFVRVLASGVKQVSTIYKTSVIVKVDGSVWSWGLNDYGQVGDGTDVNSNRPIKVIESGVTMVATGGAFTLARKNDGSLWAWGNNSSGSFQTNSLPADPGEKQLTPLKILTSGVAKVFSGQGNSMVIESNDDLKVAGDNTGGLLGLGSTTQISPPQYLPGKFSEVSGNWISHALYLKLGGSLWAAGDNGHRQLGDGSTTSQTSLTQIVANGVKSIATGNVQSFYVTTSGALWAFGQNNFGSFGAGSSITGDLNPMKVLPSGVASVSAGRYSTFIIKTDGSLWAAGANDKGQLGSGDATGLSSYDFIKVIP